MSEAVNAKTLVGLLANRHSKDVFVPECKNGPSMIGSHLRMDAWAMKKSWTRPLTTAYEVKVSRGDFLRDQKWPAYLDYCNELYFVCPAGLISPDELPENVGLLWASKNGTRLFTKRKAVHREQDIPEELFRYLLMSRTEVVSDHFDQPLQRGRREYWEQWLENKEIDFRFGQRVSRAIRKRVDERITQVERENADLLRRMENYDEIRRIIEEAGLDPNFTSPWRFRSRLTELMASVPPDLADACRSAEVSLKEFADKMRDLQEAADA